MVIEDVCKKVFERELRGELCKRVRRGRNGGPGMTGLRLALALDAAMLVLLLSFTPCSPVVASLLMVGVAIIEVSAYSLLKVSDFQGEGTSRA